MKGRWLRCFVPSAQEGDVAPSRVYHHDTKLVRYVHTCLQLGTTPGSVCAFFNNVVGIPIHDHLRTGSLERVARALHVPLGMPTARWACAESGARLHNIATSSTRAPVKRVHGTRRLYLRPKRSWLLCSPVWCAHTKRGPCAFSAVLISPSLTLYTRVCDRRCATPPHALGCVPERSVHTLVTGNLVHVQ